MKRTEMRELSKVGKALRKCSTDEVLGQSQKLKSCEGNDLCRYGADNGIFPDIQRFQQGKLLQSDRWNRTRHIVSFNRKSHQVREGEYLMGQLSCQLVVCCVIVCPTKGQ